jgi:multidrug efflux pump subunit AcrA (membrane-fusion protein)
MNSSRRSRIAVAGMICLVVFVLIVEALRPKHASGAGTVPPPDVMVAQVEQRDVPIYGEWIGTLDGLVNADVRAQVTGYLVRQDYKEGAYVNKGELLFEIDPRPFQAALDQAEGLSKHERHCGDYRFHTGPRQGLLHCQRTGLPPIAESIFTLGQTALETAAHLG